MTIKFKFSLDKSLGAMAYILKKLGPVDKVKLVKMLYIADRNHFVRFGYPITGSRQVAMDKGPLPSECLALLDGDWGVDPEVVFSTVHISDNSVQLKNENAAKNLEDSEIEVLEQVIQSFGKTPAWDLVNFTHQFPEYSDVYVQGTSKPISYESLLRIYKQGEGFRMNRPVISEAMLRRLDCGFLAASDADL